MAGMKSLFGVTLFVLAVAGTGWGQSFALSSPAMVKGWRGRRSNGPAPGQEKEISRDVGSGSSRNLFAMADWLDPKYAPVMVKLGSGVPPWVALGYAAMQ